MANVRREGIFGPLLRAKRLKRGLGLVELANIAKLDPSLLSRMETGHRLPPELSTLVVLVNALGIPPQSQEFSELLAAANRERNPDQHRMALAMKGDNPWNPFNQLQDSVVMCHSLGELVSKSTAQAIETQAEEIAVKSLAGRVTVFRIKHTKHTQPKKNS